MGIKVAKAYMSYCAMKSAEKDMARAKRFGDDGLVAEKAFAKTKQQNEMEANKKVLDDRLEEIQMIFSDGLITSLDVFKALAEIEAELKISRRDMNGLAVSVDINAHDFVGSDTTQFDAVYDKGWIITEVYRGRCRDRRSAVVLKRMPRETSDALLRRFERFPL